MNAHYALKPTREEWDKNAPEVVFVSGIEGAPQITWQQAMEVLSRDPDYQRDSPAVAGIMVIPNE